MKSKNRYPIQDIAGFIRIYKVFGLTPFSAKSFHQILLAIYQVLHLAFVVYIFFASFFIYNAFQESSLSGLVSGLVFVALSFAHVVLNLQAYHTRKEQQKIFEIFAAIDSEFKDKLTIVPNAKQWKKNFTVWFIIMTLILLGNDLVIIVTKVINHLFDGFFFSSFSRQIVRLRLIQCMHYVQMSSERLKLLNSKIEDIVASGKMASASFVILESDYGKYRFVNSTKPQTQSIDRILVMKLIFGQIWTVSNSINSCFGWSLLAIITYSFLDFTSNGYWLFLALEDLLPKYVVVECACRMIPLAFMLSTLSWVCNNCKQLSERTGCLAHKLEKSTECDQYNALVSEFSLQVMHEPIRISANGFFTIDFELLGAMAAATVTYLVILIQFLLSEKSHKSNLATVESITESATI